MKPIPINYLYLRTRAAALRPRHHAAYWFAVALIGLISFHAIPSFAGENPVIVLRSQDIAAYNEAIDGFKEGCKHANILIGDVLDLKGNVESGEKLVKGIKTKYPPPRLILSVGVLAATLAKEHFPYTPIIFCMVVNHERFDLRGDNIAGISSEASVEEQFLAFRDFFEGGKNIGIVFDPMGSSKGLVLAADHVAQRMGLNLVKSEAALPREVSTALKNIIDKIDALWIIPDHVIVAKEALDAILEITAKRRLPIFSSSVAVVKAGALLAVLPDYRAIGLQAAQTAQTILSAPSTGATGVQRPEKFRLAVNSKTAKKLGIDISRVQGRPDVVLYP